MGHRRVQALILTLVVACAGCTAGRLGRSGDTRPKGVRAPAPVGAASFEVHEQFARFNVFEIAVERPGGAAAPNVRAAFRDALYRGLIERDYSPLDPDYVDAAGDAIGRAGLTYPLRSAITSVRRTRDGGVQVSGWIGLVAPAEPGGEDGTLFLAEITDLAVPRGDQGPERDGGPETGRRLAEALLRRLPPR